MSSSTNRKAKGEADLVFVLSVLLLALLGCCFVFTQDVNRSECQNFGKVKLFGVLYECKRIEEKK